MSDRPEPGLVRAVLLDSANCEFATSGVETDVVGADARELAHDLNNVLQIIAGNLQLVQVDAAGHEVILKRIRQALAGVEHGVRLTTGLLDRCRLQGRVASVAEVIVPQRLFQIIPMLQDAVGPDVTIDVQIPDDLWLTRLDYGRLQNALLNLAINARDAMSRSGKMTLAARNAPGPPCGRGDRIVITLTDEGIGIPAEMMERIFAPFFTTKATGTGLGLAIVLAFGRASNADIAVESRPGHGTAIHLAFPRCVET